MFDKVFNKISAEVIERDGETVECVKIECQIENDEIFYECRSCTEHVCVCEKTEIKCAKEKGK